MALCFLTWNVTWKACATCVRVPYAFSTTFFGTVTSIHKADINVQKIMRYGVLCHNKCDEIRLREQHSTQQQHTISNLTLDMFQYLAPSSPRIGRTTAAFNLIVHLIAFAWKRRHLFHPLPSSQNAATVPGVLPSPHPNHPLFREEHKAAKLNQPADYFYCYQQTRVAVNPDAYAAAGWYRQRQRLSQKGMKRERKGKAYIISVL